MKLVINGFAGAGTITMGGYDYHGGRRAEGEVKDFRAGRCMGACLEYAARVGVPLMMYVFSDGSLSSDGAIDNTVDGRGKGEVDQRQPVHRRPVLPGLQPGGAARTVIGRHRGEQARHQQLGYFRADGSVETAATPGGQQREPAGRDGAAQLHGAARRAGNFAGLFPGSGSPAARRC